MQMQDGERVRLSEMRLDLKEAPLLKDGFPHHWGDPEIVEYQDLTRKERLAAILRAN